MKNKQIEVPDWLRTSSVYQVNPRTFSPEGTINAVREELPFIRELGFGILYLCPIFLEDDDSDPAHLSPRQKRSGTGNPKNPYRINDYFAIDEEYGTMEDLKRLVVQAHELGMRVLLDLVYAHIGPHAEIITRNPSFVCQEEDGSFICTNYGFPKLDFKCEGLREYLYCNMQYYVGQLDVDGFRCDIGDAVPLDFWLEGKKRIQALKADAVLINEGLRYDYLSVAFHASYSWKWHEKLYAVFTEKEPPVALMRYEEELKKAAPTGAMILRDIDNHDTVTDWPVRTEIAATAEGMEQITVINFLIDGIPMVYAGNELGDKAKLSMFANRFYMGDYSVTDRGEKDTPTSRRRQQIMKKLNALKKEREALKNGKTEWNAALNEKGVIAFSRIGEAETIVFIGNPTSKPIRAEGIPGGAVLLENGNGTTENGSLYLFPRSYKVLVT